MFLDKVFTNANRDLFGLCNSFRPCPDMFCAIVDLDKNVFTPILKSWRNFRKVDLKTIAIVIESPHKREYGLGGIPIAPARGTTGRNLKNYLIKHLHSLGLFEGVYKVLLIEAVSFQCSNGCNLRKKENSEKRDLVFNTVWNNGGREAFKKRIKKYSPDVLINACTGGLGNIDSGTSLNSLVQQAICELEAYKSATIYYSVHPCCRHYKNCMTKIYRL